MLVGRAIGWFCVVLGAMVSVRDLLLLADLGRWRPLTVAEAPTLFDHSGPPVLPAIPDIWVGMPLLAAAGLLLVLCRRARLARPGWRRSGWRPRR